MQARTRFLKERSILSKEFCISLLISFQSELLVAGDFSWLRKPTSDTFAEAWRQDWEIRVCSLDFQGDRYWLQTFFFTLTNTGVHSHAMEIHLNPRGPFVFLKHLLNASVFLLAAQSHLEGEHNGMSVSICYCQSLLAVHPMFIVFWEPVLSIFYVQSH